MLEDVARESRTGGSAMAIASIVSIAVIFVAVGIAWTFRKASKARSARKAQRNAIAVFDNVEQRAGMTTVDLVNTFNKAHSSGETHPKVAPYFQPHLSTYLPAPMHSPPRVYTPGTGLLILPRLDYWDTNGATTLAKEHSLWDRPGINHGSDGMGTFPHDEVGQPCILPVPSDLVVHIRRAVEDSGEGTDLHSTHSAWKPSLLPSTLSTPVLEALSLPYVPPERGLRAERSKTNTQLPSPPPTPTLPTFTLASSTECLYMVSEGAAISEDDQSWPDVLSLKEYEREESLILTRTLTGVRKQLPSPPPTPTLLFTPSSPPRAIPTDTSLKLDEGLLHVETATSNIGKLTHKGLAKAEEAMCSYAGIGGGSAEFMLGHDQAKAAQARRVDASKAVKDDSPPPYRRMGFNYELLLAQKRALSPLSSISIASTKRILLKQVTPIVRPRPPLQEFKPLLLRKVDRSKLRAQPIFTNFPGGPHDCMLSTTVPIQRERTEFGSRSVVYAPVKVLEVHEECKERGIGVAM